MNWTDNMVTRALGRIFDLMLLNILWIICSIPIFTIGASTTALYTVMLKLVKNEEGYIAKGFFLAFKDNFKKSTTLWLILGVVGVGISIDLRFALMLEGLIRTIFQSLFLILGLAWVSITLYVFPLSARYENSIKNTLKNAFILSLAKLPYTIVMIAFLGVLIVITLLNTNTILLGTGLWLIIGVAFVAWVNSLLLRKVFEVLHVEADQKTEVEKHQ